MSLDTDHRPLPETALTKLGFTKLEASAYCELLRSGASSGYRLSQLLGKAPANVYQALGALSQKGAVIVSEEEKSARIYSPLPPQELMVLLKRSFDDSTESVMRAVEHLYHPTNDERVHTIANATQVIEKARDMLGRAEKIVLLDFFPEIYDLLRTEIDSARDRGLAVAGLAYEERHAGSQMPLNRESAGLVGERWPGLGLILIIDGAEFLIAQLSRDMTQVLNAVWSDSLFISCVLHSAVAADIRLTALRADSSDPLSGLTLNSSTPPGLERLLSDTDKP